MGEVLGRRVWPRRHDPKAPGVVDLTSNHFDGAQIGCGSVAAANLTSCRATTSSEADA